ncbi:MAG: GGDEF domain-containing protein [Thermoanaerobaculia bacterium]
MELGILGLLVQTVGAGLLSVIFLYLSRGKTQGVLQAAGFAWLFLFLALAAQALLTRWQTGFEKEAYQYFKLLYLVALCAAAIRMGREVSLAKPLSVTAVAALPIAILIGRVASLPHRFYAVHMGILAVGWLLVAVFIFQSPRAGLGRQFSGLLALLTSAAQFCYVVLFTLQPVRGIPFLPYTGFVDVLFEMLFGIGLIIWAMEDTERRLAALHSRTVDDTRRSQRRAWMDPLTDTHNRFFLDEIKPQLESSETGGSIVLIDVDGLKTINDQEGHDEGDRAIWTVATAIKKLVRGNDHVIRWGGDEFLVILPGMDEELARRRFYMLPAKIDEVKQSPRAGGKPYTKFLAASVGVHNYSRRVPLDVAISQADRVMYERKRAHRELRGPAGERNTR